VKCPARAIDEDARLRALAEYGLDETKGLPSLDAIVDMAARLFSCEASAVNMIGDDRVFFAASAGIGEADMRRDVSFCAHAINQHDVLVVEDAALDPRFHDNPIVAAGMIRFYAGIALRSPSGHALGALCVLDGKPRAGFSREEELRLGELAKMVSDKLELQRLQHAAANQSERFGASAATSSKAFICFGPDTRISDCNMAASQMFGWRIDELVGQPVDMLIAQDDWPIAHRSLSRVLGGGPGPTPEGTLLTGIKRDGTQFPTELFWSEWREGEDRHFGAIVQDMTERMREHDALYRLANFDTLTDLPNHHALHRRIEEALKADEPVAVVLTDLEGFADINNTLGHAAGDEFLLEISARLTAALPADVFLAHIGGGDFAAVVVDHDVTRSSTVARAILETVARPFTIDGHELRVAGHAGIALAPAHGESAEALMGSAALALFHARGIGRGESYIFIPALRAQAVARRMYDAELHRAFERDEFALFYQPQVDLYDGRVIGAEALIRWCHPVRGWLAPAAFLPALEAGVLAAPVGLWVIDAACAQLARWRHHDPDFAMSVNLSAALLRDGELPCALTVLLAKHGVPASALELEITENILLDGQDDLLAQFEAIRALGVRLSFDDFGTGFASLNLLRSFPVDQIKIDKSFTHAMRGSPREQVIVSGLAEMANKLKIEVVAEGIESVEDADFLRAHGCSKGQGYLFGAPVPARVFAERFLLHMAIRSTG
jgi:diguanylate cyclase (GGDEF)-like protein/PAS domain S-box-containing protein